MEFKVKASWGGFPDHFWTYARRGAAPDSTNMDKGREGVKNPEICADVLNGSPLNNNNQQEQ